jgi:UDP-N-acetylmuramoyl-L-alanyl-D-glutamate--2,6-diaminopimelate ligase
MTFRGLIKKLGIRTQTPFANFFLRGISCNSKDTKRDFVFVALKGSCQDGNKFIQEAVANGARAVISQEKVTGRLPESQRVAFVKVSDARKVLAQAAAEFYGHPSLGIKVIGITGTNGKTTVAYLIEAILKQAGFLPAVLGTVNYRFGDKVIPAKNTTPGAVELQSLLAQMLKAAVDYCALEVSSHALDQERTAGIKFHSAIFTNLTQDHLDYHKTIRNYFQCKLKLFHGLEDASFAVVNNDSGYTSAIKKATSAKVVSYALENKATVMAEDLRMSTAGVEFLLKAPHTAANFKSRLIGRHNVYNILAAVTWALTEKIEIQAIKSAVEKFRCAPGRLEKIEFSGNFTVFVDYAHTDDALKNVLSALRCLTHKRLIIVFGCGGERDKLKRPKMGQVASELADYAIITNDNPRSEDPQQIIRDIRAGIAKDNYCVIPERVAAIKRALSLARCGDIVLVAGKGHEHYQIIKDKLLPFDDHKIVKECLKSLN